MYCTNCGNMVRDDDLFCTNCGTKIQRPENHAETKTMEKKEAVNFVPIKNHIPEAVPVERPVQELEKISKELVREEKDEVIPVNISIQPVPSFQEQNPAINRSPENPSVYYNNSGGIEEAEQNVKQKSTIIPLAVFSVIFAVLTIAAAVIEMLDGSSEISDVARLIELSIASVIVLIFAVTNIKTVSTLKGIALIIFMVSDIIFVGFSSVEYAIDALGNGVKSMAKYFDVSEGIISAYMVTIIVWFVSMYIFFMADAIRAFINTRKAKTITLLFGYISLLAVIMQILSKLIIEGEIKLYLGFMPMNLTYIFFLIAVMLGISSKKKIAKI